MQRLKTRVQFEAVMAGGRTLSRTEHFALHAASLEASRRAAPAAERSSEPPATEGRSSVQPTGPGPERSPALFAVRTEPWLGAIVPKRWAKRAVTRNAIKRQIYTVSQAFESQLPVAALVVRLRAGFDRQVFLSATSTGLKRAVRLELQQLFAGARR